MIDDRERLTEMSFAMRTTSAASSDWQLKSAFFWSCLIPNSITRFSVATLASACHGRLNVQLIAENVTLRQGAAVADRRRQSLRSIRTEIIIGKIDLCNGCSNFKWGAMRLKSVEMCNRLQVEIRPVKDLRQGAPDDLGGKQLRVGWSQCPASEVGLRLIRLQSAQGEESRLLILDLEQQCGRLVIELVAEEPDTRQRALIHEAPSTPPPPPPPPPPLTSRHRRH